MIISYLRLDPSLNQNNFDLLRQQLPEQLQQRNDRFFHFIDRQRNLLGWLLLKKLWSDQFHGPLPLQDLKTTAYKRPYLPGFHGDFNISHAGEIVICVVSPLAKVGIDVENRKEVDFGEFTRTMNQEQWSEIKTSNDPAGTFFKYWSIKESVIKADGRGLSIPLTEILLHPGTVSYSNFEWYIKPFLIDQNHYGCLASDQPITKPELNLVRWQDFLI